MASTRTRLLTFNLRHGGGRRMERIQTAILSHAPDIVALTEYRENEVSRALRAALADYGLVFQQSSAPPPRVNGVLIASRFPFEAIDVAPPLADAWRCAEAQFAAFSVCAMYFPSIIAKRPVWEWVMQRARTNDQPLIFTGDFNTGKHYVDERGASFVCAEYLDHLEALGYVDAWRVLHPDEREYTWYSHRANGFRLDYTFLSPSLAPMLVSAYHSHHERTAGISDHSALIADLAC